MNISKLISILSTILIVLTIIGTSSTTKVLLKINYSDTKCTKGKEASYTLVQDCSIVGRFESVNETFIVWFNEAHSKNKTNVNYCNNYHYPTIYEKVDSCISNGKSSSYFSIKKLNEPKNPIAGAGQCEFYFYPIKDCSNFAYKDVVFNKVCFQDNKTLRFKYTTCNETHTNEYSCEDINCKKDCKLTASIDNGPPKCGELKKNGQTIYRSFKNSKK